MAVISKSNDHSRITEFSCIVNIVNELKKLMGANCITWFWGAMVARHNFFPSLYLHCLFILTEILDYNGTMMRSTMALMDGVGGTIKRVVYGLFQSRHININTAEEFSADAFKGVSSIKSLYLSQEDNLLKMLQQLKDTWMYITLSVIIFWKMSVFLSSVISLIIKNLFILSINLD